MEGSIKIPLEQLKPGMILAEPVYHPLNFQLVWNAGMVLSQKQIDILKQMQVASLRVVDFKPQAVGRSAPARPLMKPIPKPSTKPLPPPRSTPELKAVGHEVLVRNVTLVRQIGEQVRQAHHMDFKQVDNCVQTTIQKIVANKELLNSLVDLRVYDEYTYAHSANVMSLALVTGYAMKYPPERLRILGIGALLHDLGKNMVPDEVLNKPGPLDPAELEIMRTHPSHGVMILNDYQWATSEIRNIVFQHHEKLDGSGYPLKLTGDRISEMAKIVSVVDFYDALISDRCYKKGLPPNVAYQAIMDSINTHFDPRIVQAFQRFIVPYPVNSIVWLNTGQKAKVVQVNRQQLLRPVVLVEDQRIDLALNRQLTITNLAC